MRALALVGWILAAVFGTWTWSSCQGAAELRVRLDSLTTAAALSAEAFAATRAQHAADSSAAATTRAAADAALAVAVARVPPSVTALERVAADTSLPDHVRVAVDTAARALASLLAVCEARAADTSVESTCEADRRRLQDRITELEIEGVAGRELATDALGHTGGLRLALTIGPGAVLVPPADTLGWRLVSGWCALVGPSVTLPLRGRVSAGGSLGVGACVDGRVRPGAGAVVGLTLRF